MISYTNGSYQSLLDFNTESVSSKKKRSLSSREGSSFYELIVPDALVPSRHAELAFLKIKIEQLPRTPNVNADRYRSLMTIHQVRIAYHLSYVHSIRPII